MKHRLSDHDELIVQDLAANWTGQGYRTSPGQGKLDFVWLAEGRAWGVSPYYLGSVPVETDVEGAIPTHEAIAGGTVNIDTKSSSPSGRSLWNLCKPATCLPAAFRRDLLEEHVRRQARQTLSRRTDSGTHGLSYVLPQSYDHCARIVWADGSATCNDGRIGPYSNGVQGTVEGRWLARAFCLVLDHGEARTITLTLNDAHGFVVCPAGWTPDDPFALVMAVRTKTADWTPPHPHPPP